jgi:succinyl-diaminopimelate desuccinylase
MGGGTYAKGIKNTIAFVGMFPDSENCHMHDNDEFANIDELLKQTEIYVHALLKLLDI